MKSRINRRPLRALLGLAMSLSMGVLTACGSSDDTVPDAEQLAKALLTTDDIAGEWSVNLGPDDSSAAIDPSGVVTEDQRGMLPTIDLCDRASAESKKTVESLRPLAFRQLDLKVDDPIDPPTDRSGHLVFVQEFLYSGESPAMKDTFAAIRDGLSSCLGTIPAGEEGPGTAATFAVPSVGDERVGVLATISEAGGWAEWVIHQVFVRQGPTLMSLVIVDIRAGEGVEPYFSTGAVDLIVRTAVDALDAN